jgi:hypothetical protein
LTDRSKPDAAGRRARWAGVSARRAAALVLATICAVASAAFAGTGGGSTGLRQAALLLACLFIAAVVVLLPSMLRARMGLFVAAFVAAAGVVSIFVQPGDERVDPPSTSPLDVPRTNPDYLAELIERGPFNQELPQGMTATGTRPTSISDPSSAGKVTAVQVVIRPDDPEIQLFAHIEVYRRVEDAGTRATASMESLKQRFDAGLDPGSIASFCVDTGMAWTCAGSRKYVYAEVSLAPGSYVNLALTNEILGDLLGYADDRTKAATD